MGHSVVGVGYYDPDPSVFDFKEFFICQDNWSSTPRYVAVPAAFDGTRSDWIQSDYLWPTPQGYIWVGGTVGSETQWGANANWINWNDPNVVPTGFMPDGTGVTVTFGNQPADHSVVNIPNNIDGLPISVGHIIFAPNTPTTILSTEWLPFTAGLILDNGNNGNNVATITVSGSHNISAGDNWALAVVLNSNVNITVVNSIDHLSINSFIFDGNNGAKGITKTGNGTLTLTALNFYTGQTDVEGGILEINTIANAGANSSIGRSASVNLILGTGTTLRYIGEDIAGTDRGLTHGR